MEPRTRDTLLLIAGVPGIVALFLPVPAPFSPIVPVDYLWGALSSRHLGNIWMFSGLDWAVTLPVVVALVQALRLWRPSKVDGQWWLLVLAVLVALQLGWSVVSVRMITKIKWALPREWLELGPSALWVIVPAVGTMIGNLWLLYRNTRRKRPLRVRTEVLLLGTYITAMIFWLPDFLREPFVAPRLMAWTCLVYLATIVIRLRASPVDERL